MKQRPTTRACDECRACCLPWAVPEVGKHSATWCPKLTPCGGCSIYDSRPKECSEFACIWLNGKGEPSDRPDILGVIMDIEDFKVVSGNIGIFHLWEITPGALEKPRVRAIAEANKNAGIIIAHHRLRDSNTYETTYTWRAGLLSAAQEKMFKQKNLV